MRRRIVVKVGSGVISDSGLLNADVLKDLVSQITALRSSGIDVILVTSGAVATGRGVLGKEVGNTIADKQALAAVGQVALMARYRDLFQEKGVVSAQILVTKEDFRDRQHYLNMRQCLENLITRGIVPIVNENDVIAVTELLFTDNDELAGLLASALDADMLIILTSVEGVLKGDPKDPNAEVISEIDFAKDSVESHITSDRSASGRGGMHTKFGIAKKLAKEGIETRIANGRRAGVLADIVAGAVVGTRFVPDKKLSSVKRRIAHSDGLAKASVFVNECTEGMLAEGKAMSLLPIGVTRIEGGFEKGDVIVIRSAKGTQMGFGVAKYDSHTLAGVLGQKDGPVLVHYDYLFIG